LNRVNQERGRPFTEIEIERSSVRAQSIGIKILAGLNSRDDQRQAVWSRTQDTLTKQKRFHSGPAVDWIDLICRAWQQRSADTLSDNLELGQLVWQARQTLSGHGEWSHLFQYGRGRLPFSKRKADHFVAIGQVFGGSGGESTTKNMCSQLPPGWRILSSLARLGRPLVEQLVIEGRIHPRLSLSASRALLAELLPESRKKIPRSRLRNRFRSFAKFIHQNSPNWSAEDSQYAQHELRRLLDQISKSKMLTRPINHYA
jgi:hypothetical protein